MFLGHEHYFQLPIEYFEFSIFDLAHNGISKLVEALLKYCELDTFAMVMLVEELRECIKL
jgi:hypothetical protein